MERTEERGDKTRSEFHFGTFTRSVPLPRTAVKDGITATCVAGVLEIRVPLAGTVPAGREIPVHGQRKAEHKRT